MTVTPSRNAAEPFRPFAASSTLPPGADPDAWAAWRQAGGLPTVRQEYWKYTNLQSLRDLTFGTPGALPRTLPDALPSLPGACRLTVFNGSFAPALSDPLPKGVLRLTDNGTNGLWTDEAWRDEQAGGLPALNAALSGAPLRLRVEAGAAPEAPLHILFLSAPGAEPLLHQPCLTLTLESGSRATLLESHLSIGQGAETVTNSASRIHLSPGARLEHYKVQDQADNAVHMAMVGVTVANDASYQGLVLQAGGRLSRHQARVTLAGPGARMRLDGVSAAAGARHLDNTLFIDHAAPDAWSRALFHHALAGTCRGVFQGVATVRPGAQRTDSHQLSRTLLLAPGAVMDARPELEIHADDVRCGHGATSGALDGAQVFYLRSRGLSEAEARTLLLRGFLSQPLAAVESAPARAFLETALDTVLERLS